MKVPVESLIGKPFMTLPGNPPDHKVMGTVNGFPVRVKEAEQMFNDMLLIDATQGPNSYFGSLSTSQARAVFSFVMGLYRTPSADAVERWINIPKMDGPVEWGKV